ncbi:MAG: uL15 family ribosomal protein [Candidatus Heimdallarchaeaceae archaeon]
MAVRTRKKSRKYRGTRSHGWGKTKKHRKSGLRGGVGKAAPKSHHWLQVITGKRAPIGKKGFTRPPTATIKLKTINVSHLEAMLPTLVKRGKAAHKEGIYEVDLSILGYDKLLGQGEILTPVKIKVEYATEAAIDKVKAVGGEVILLSE